MIAKRLEGSLFTTPMIFLGFGALLNIMDILPTSQAEPLLHIIAEVTLVVLLFLDAAQIDQRALLRRSVWPTRMLLIGLPLTFILGAGIGLLILDGWSTAMVALVAAILVPTDAALGQPVLTSPDVPERPRRALTVESGLNDGLALPLVLMMAAFAAPLAMAPSEGWFVFGVKQVLIGPLIGIPIGLLTGWGVLWAKKHDTTSDIYEGIGALALAAMSYLCAQELGGNGFIAAFSAGLGFGAIVRGKCAFIYEFTESEGQLLSWGAFLLLGAAFIPEAIAQLTWAHAFLILLSIFVIRPLAIWISLIGSDASPATRIFFGWFGPKGLATALFALLVLEDLGHGLADPVLWIAINAVWISALLHGLSAAPGAKLYAARLKGQDEMPEHAPHTPSDPAFLARMA